MLTNKSSVEDRNCILLENSTWKYLGYVFVNGVL